MSPLDVDRRVFQNLRSQDLAELFPLTITLLRWQALTRTSITSLKLPALTRKTIFPTRNITTQHLREIMDGRPLAPLIFALPSAATPQTPALPMPSTCIRSRTIRH